MNYEDIENYTLDKDTKYEETIINWRIKRGVVQLKCPKCSDFFALPKDIPIDENGYCFDKIYHFCIESKIDGEFEENNEGWVVLPHLVGWSVK